MFLHCAFESLGVSPWPRIADRVLWGGEAGSLTLQGDENSSLMILVCRPSHGWILDADSNWLYLLFVAPSEEVEILDYWRFCIFPRWFFPAVELYYPLPACDSENGFLVMLSGVLRPSLCWWLSMQFPLLGSQAFANWSLAGYWLILDTPFCICCQNKEKVWRWWKCLRSRSADIPSIYIKNAAEALAPFMFTRNIEEVVKIPLRICRFDLTKEIILLKDPLQHVRLQKLLMFNGGKFL